MAPGPWFSPPCELLPAPPQIVGRPGDSHRARRPPALLQPLAPSGEVTGKKRCLAAVKEQPPEAGASLRDRALDVPDVVHLRHGRYLQDGRVVAVPQKVEDWNGDLVDDKNEILVVDLAAPGGGWFDDVEVSHVHVQVGEASSPRLVPIALVRELVRARVQLFARPAASLRKLDVPCRLKQSPQYTVVLISMSELEGVLAVSEKV